MQINNIMHTSIVPGTSSTVSGLWCACGCPCGVRADDLSLNFKIWLDLIGSFHTGTGHNVLEYSLGSYEYYIILVSDKAWPTDVRQPSSHQSHHNFPFLLLLNKSVTSLQRRTMRNLCLAAVTLLLAHHGASAFSTGPLSKGISSVSSFTPGVLSRRSPRSNRINTGLSMVIERLSDENVFRGI